MYLEHFGLNEPPFRITPVTVFFFSGANRGEILDALIYSISEVEGIIKVSGEVGSGKTMLCRMLLERLPAHIEAIYLANPSLSREEMLYAIADGLGLNIKDERVGIIMQSIQNKLVEKAREGKRIVVLVDEAHAMPLDTLEELRLLYNLQVGNAKLLQIVLFGQPELNAKLEQPNMRQLKDRIAHHFHMQPLSRSTLENYLMFRMRAAGYHGPDIFSADAIKNIADASNGLMRRVNILADKSLLAAFVEDTHSIESRHVKAAMRDSELGSPAPKNRSRVFWTATVVVLIIASLTAWLLLNGNLEAPKKSVAPTNSAIPLPPVTPEPISTPPAEAESHNIQAPVPQPASEPATGTITPINPDQPPEPVPAPTQKTEPETLTPVPAQTPGNAELPQSDTTTRAAPEATATIKTPTPTQTILFDQRMEAGRQLVAEKRAVASLQLFYNEVIRQERIEGFLKRADALGVLSDIYLLPAKFGSKQGVRVLFGAYPSIEAAREATKTLPKKYKNAFAASIYIY